MLKIKHRLWLTSLLVTLFLFGCATANKRYHGITIGSDLAFEFGSAKLTAEGKQMIDEYAAMIENQKNIRVAVVGHADRIGNEANNEKLALQRAQAVRSQLIKSKLDPQHVVVRSEGAREPLVECNQTNRKALIECLAPNRRVEVFVNKIPGM